MRQTPRSRLLDPWVIGAVLAIVALTASRPCFVREAPPPPAGAFLRSFALVDQHDKAFGSAELAGRIWVAALMPPDPGPKATRAIEGVFRLQEAWAREGQELALVLIATDPQAGPPALLREQGVARGADFARLKFLTGDADSTCEVASAFVEDPRLSSCEGLTELAERGRLLLVDADGRSRGLYRGDTLGVEEVHFRALALFKRR